MHHYAGIGSRTTPPDILRLMTAIAKWLDLRCGYTLHSGGAVGADTAFAAGSAYSVIFTARDAVGQPRWVELAQRFHPNWPACVARGDYVCRLHARNSAIIMGADLTSPVSFVICWTPGGLGGGGTGQALRIARHYHIPIVDLGDPKTLAHMVPIMQTLVGQPVILTTPDGEDFEA